MSRWKAAAIHLSISALIGLATAALVFGVWFPPPYSHAAGADRLILLLLGVDIVVGPLLTLIVYRHGKWGMRFDLWVIALLQAGAFLYGMSVVLTSRPVFVVADDGAGQWHSDVADDFARAIVECAVVGVSDEEWGERVSAAVELRPGAGNQRGAKGKARK